MILPIGHEEMSVRRLPWVTFAIMATCTGLVFVTDTTFPSETFSEFGLIPDDPSWKALFSHMFLHAGWVHLAGNLFMLFLAGPPVEDRWGRPLYAAFFVTSGVFAGAFYMATAPGSPLPLVGASGAIAGVLGACMVRFWSRRIRFLYVFLIPPRLVRGTFWAPAWVMLPLWFGSELLSAAITDTAGVTGGTAYWCHVGGFIGGATFAGAIRFWKIEERFIHPAIEDKITVMENPLIDEAMDARTRGDVDTAYELLSTAARRTPDDPEIATALWEVACDKRCADVAAPHMLRIAALMLERGDTRLAAHYWTEVAERAPEVRADPDLLLALAPILAKLERHREAVLALRHAIERETSTETAMRVMNIAGPLDARTAAAAGRIALGSEGIGGAERRQLEARVEAFEAEAERTPTRVAGGFEDRSIAIDLDDDPVAPVLVDRTPGPTRPALAGSHSDPRPGPQPDRPDAAPLALDASGQLGASDSAETADDDEYLGLPPDEVMPQSLGRFVDVKTLEAVPVELTDDTLVVERPGGVRGPLALARVDAVAVGAVQGLSARPVLVVDLALNWSDAHDESGLLNTIRLRGDRFDPRALMPGGGSAVDAFRALVAELLARSGATPLPDEASARGNPFRSFADLESYLREALEVG